ncbi:MAG: hypothetical protein ACRCS0_02475 [Albidovulum sp.]
MTGRREQKLTKPALRPAPGRNHAPRRGSAAMRAGTGATKIKPQEDAAKTGGKM